MPFRMYFVPVVGAGVKGNARRPKYFADGTFTPNPQFDWMDYGLEPAGCVGADLTPAQDTQVAAAADVNAVPFDLDSNPSPAGVTAAQNYLESINVPAGWVNTGLTWREIVKNVLNMFAFVQRYTGEYSVQNPGQAVPHIFTGGRTLATQWSALPVAMQNAMLSAATSLKIDTTGLSGTTTLRTIFKSMSDQLSATMRYVFLSNVIWPIS